MTMHKLILRAALVAAMVLCATMPAAVAHARLIRRPPILVNAPKPSDMVEGSCLIQQNGWYLCEGKDGATYACKPSEDRCVKLSG